MWLAKLTKLYRFLYYDVFSRIIPNYFHLLKRELKGCNSVLDMGCGTGNFLLLRIFQKHKCYSLGIDAFLPSIQECRKKKIYDKCIHKDVLKTSFKKNSFDCVLALDFIEHLEKKKALKLIKYMESVARKKVILFTPNGFLKQEAVEGSKWQEHKSGWSTGELQKLGYTVYGASGIKPLKGYRASIKYKPWFFWLIISELSQFFVYKNPAKAFHLFCVKKL